MFQAEKQCKGHVARIERSLVRPESMNMGENGRKIKLKVQLGVCGVTKPRRIVLPEGKFLPVLNSAERMTEMRT